MTIYLVVQPVDYETAYVDVFKTLKEAREFMQSEAEDGANIEYWKIIQEFL